jgi:hypothetical protein
MASSWFRQNGVASSAHQRVTQAVRHLSFVLIRKMEDNQKYISIFLHVPD